MTQNFTVIIPTFTGAEVIDGCLESILYQRIDGFQFDVIVVIDGPNQALKKKVLLFQREFLSRGINFKIIEHEKNLGHFEARYRGARESQGKYVLFIDDRVKVSPEYFKSILAEKSEAVIPSVVEDDSSNFISETINLLRLKLYRKHSRATQSVLMTLDNFDTVPKGTTSFWVKRNYWIDACEEVMSKFGQTKNISDDTRILKLILNKTPMLKSINAKIIYRPREKAIDELLHLFKRGPKFVDYYYRPSSPYFVHLIAFQLACVVLLLMLLLAPQLAAVFFLSILIVNIFISAYLSHDILQGIRAYFGFMATGLAFTAGIIKGLILEYYLALSKVYGSGKVGARV